MPENLISNNDVVVGANEPICPGGAVDDSGGDIILRTSGVERARIKADGTGSGWPSILGGYSSAPAVSGDTTGATDRAAIQAVIDALPASGGWILFPKGTYYLDATGLSISKPVKMVGAGGKLSGDAGTTPAVALTTFYCPNSTGDAITVTAAGCVFEDFALINTAGVTPTAGTGIKDTASNNSVFSRLTILGFWNNLDLGGMYANVGDCHLYDAVNYYAYLHAATGPYNDNGVTYFKGCTISGYNRNYVAPAGIRYESGGGSKIVECYFNGGSQPGNATAGRMSYAIDLAVADGVSTSSLTITGNTITGAQLAMVRVSEKGVSNTGTFSNLVITGNEIVTGQGGGNTCVGILLNGNAQNLHEAEITGNLFNNLAGGGITVSNFAGVHIGPNHWGRNMTGPLITLAASPDAGNATIAPRVDRQSLGTLDAIDVIFDNRSASITHGGFASTAGLLTGGVAYDYERQVVLTTNGSWQSEFVIKIPRASGGVIEVEVVGQNGVTGNGTGASRKGVYLKQVRSYDVSVADAVTLTTVGTDVANGAGGTFLALQYVLANNQITVQVQTTDVTQCWFGGICRVKAQGKLDTFHIGA